MNKAFGIFLAFIVLISFNSCDVLNQLAKTSQQGNGGAKPQNPLENQKIYAESIGDCAGDSYRYTQPVFRSDQIKTYKNTAYASFNKSEQWNNGNVTVPCFGKKPFTYPSKDGQLELRMDIYMPNVEFDQCTDRPIIIYAHPGGYSPTNTPSKNDVFFGIHATQMAQMGYVVAVVDYRKGFDTQGLQFHPNSNSARFGNAQCRESSSVDFMTFQKSLFRMTQDIRAAHRFLHANADKLNVNPNLTFYAGGSTGALGVTHAAYAHQNANWKFLNMGKVEDFGDYNEYESQLKVAGVIAQQPAIHNIDWIEASDNVPIFMLHGNKDMDVPFGDGYMGSMISYGGRKDKINHFRLYGSQSIYNKIVGLKGNTLTKAGLLIFDGNDHNQATIAKGQCKAINNLVVGQWRMAYEFSTKIINNHHRSKSIALKNTSCTYYQPASSTCTLSCDE